jgi:diguanylate cyclase (GGDEF)-like protein
LLQLWLAVALTTSALDGVLNAVASGRYTVSWYLAKSETLVTAGVVLLVLLSQIGALYRRLGTMAIIDPLTGLRNRRSFDEYVRWTLSRRTKSEIAFLLLDIDFFKQYNDRYGHASGDQCLRRIADVTRTSLWRAADLVARFGGEEFVVLLPDTSAAGARDIAERIRSNVEALAIAHAGSSVAPVVTVSIGVAHAFLSHAVDADALFALADRALYEAKSRRNATVVAESIVTVAAPVPQLRPYTLT